MKYKKPKYNTNKKLVQFFLENSEKNKIIYGVNYIYGVDFYIHQMKNIKHCLDKPKSNIPKSGSIIIEYSYPFVKPIYLEFKNIKTCVALAMAIYNGYKLLYAIENGDQRPKIWNLKTNIKHMNKGSLGIWGHHINDLCFHDAILIKAPKKLKTDYIYHLSVSS